MEQKVHLKKEAGVAVVTIQNLPLNILSSQVVKELGEVFSLIGQDSEIVAVVLTGAGNQAFIAGADIKEFPQLMGHRDIKERVIGIHHVLNKIHTLPKPTIAMLNGITFGGGCEVALTCDIRVAEKHVQIALPEVKLGLFPGGGGTQRLPRLIGEAKAKEIMFTGEPVTAEEAHELGLVNHVLPSGHGMEAALTLARKIAGYSLQSLSRIKKAVDEGIQKSMEEGIELEMELLVDIFQTEDIKEGIQAFIEKRSPAFKHK